MIKAIVTDIEGTTSSLSFVKDVLFPYARVKLPDYVRQHQDEPTIKQLLADTCNEANISLNTENAIEQLIEWIDQDKKITPLKALQGLIWETGYKQGDFTGHLYQDAIDNLNTWKAKGIALYVYSSGSVLAQKLLFGHTASGDLTPLFSGFFDTNIGGKKEPDSYRKIADEIAIPPANILFLSDIKEELDAAKTVGYRTIWLTRHQAPDTKAAHLQVDSFDDIIDSAF
ncbi:enolase-phosphatase E1 [Methyloglobulus morosus KoM1]|uniref:Enolase-phosphatase E1 n=1 Tax=Methyloglobulus morosus KoM1 TaxID=1116472 RepID=V5BTA5_9GAMM|nr:acireductone synthase [Methyloglobulus morosus]ESS69437.1 enolase-phosphatase E1 [Methyloglobulus morosus KoM1]